MVVLVLAACGPTAMDTVCTTDACPAPAAPTCNGTTLVVTDTATCTDDNGAASCNYATEMTDCSATGMLCMMGACVAPDDPCASATCNTPPDPSCADTVLTTYASTGTCDSSSGTAVCSYAPTTNDCADAGQVCQNGACFDACVGATCNTPPDATCTENTLTTYAATGTCDGSTGGPVCSYTPTQTDCTATDQICSAGACVDPCTPNPCDAPPADTCVDGETQAHHADPGTCTSPAGVVSCDYPVSDVDCSASNEACSAGACVDPCVGFTCDTPPATTCVGTVIESFAAAGTCSATAGVPGCGYAETDVDCAFTGQTCSAATCIGTALFARVQFPATIVDVPGTTQTVYGRIYVQGVTDQSGVDDHLPANVLVEFGLGTGTDPTTYTYVAANANAAYGPGSADYEANNDEYLAMFVINGAVGTTQSYAFRLSDDGGATWIYGDTGIAGSSDGFTAPGIVDIAGPYFSEYVESTDITDNKAVEIYNPGSLPFSLSGCGVKVFANGSATGTTTALTTTASIDPGGVYTLCKTGIGVTCNQTTGAGLWNGNDAIELVCGTTVYDVFGQIGTDPGAAGWGTGATSSVGDTLLRDCDVFAGDPDGSDAFDPATQWAGYPLDTLMYLGARNCPLP